tara:strand:- start:1508 stop:1681 length:174 start_codon:yes stop_codon:yes gene_type:complete
MEYISKLDNKTKIILKNSDNVFAPTATSVVNDIIAAVDFIQKSNFYNGEILKLNGGR